MFTEAHPFVGTWHVIALLETHMGKYASDGKDEYKHRNRIQGLFKKKGYLRVSSTCNHRPTCNAHYSQLDYL